MRKYATAQIVAPEVLIFGRVYALSFLRRRLRHTVWVTLGAWLFALTAGVVNACMLVPQGSAGHGVLAALSSQSAAQTDHASALREAGQLGHDESVPEPGQVQDAGEVSCLKFCDDESSALSKRKTSALDLGEPHLVAVAPGSPIVQSRILGTKRSLLRPAVHGPPMAICFLRLTL